MFTDNAEEFVRTLQQFSGNKIKNAEEIIFLINAALESRVTTEFEKLVFTAKYINGLRRVIASGAGNPEVTNIEQIRQDMMENYGKAVNGLNLLLEREDVKKVELFRTKYLQLDQNSFSNLNSLLDDLEWVKMYLNEIKRK